MSSSIGLVMIACDVGRTLGRALDSIKDHVQEIIVVDTGSSDDTKQVAKRFGARVFDFNPETHPGSFILDAPESWTRSLPGPFTHKKRLCEFATARQFGWDNATSDYLMWIDADDSVEGAEKIPEVLADMKVRSVDAALLNYDYEHDDEGNVTLRLPRERIVKQGACHWEQPVHEVLMPTGLGTFYPLPNIIHHRGKDKLPPLWHQRNLKILLHWWEKNKVVEEKVDPRMLFYLAMEERYLYPEEALKHFSLYTKRSGWDEERAMAHYLAGTLHERAARYHEALSEYSLARMEFKNNPDGLLGCARCAYFLSNWQKVVEWTDEALEVIAKNAGRPTLLMEDPYDRSWRPYVFLSAALVNTGQYTRAVKICEDGLKIKPDDPHLRGNLQISRDYLDKASKPRTSAGHVDLQFRRSEPLDTPPIDIPSDVLLMIALQIWKRCESSSKKKSFLESLPDILASDPKVVEAKSFRESWQERGVTGVPSGLQENTRLPPTGSIGPGVTGSAPRKPEKLKIVIWTGPAWEKWSPASINSGGIGGSETAAVHMARELSLRGHKVYVLGTWNGKYEDVTYIDHQSVDRNSPEFHCDVFISSRQPLVLLEDGWQWKSSFVWAHDIHVGQSSDTKRALLKADGLLALSRWHADYMGKIYTFLPSSNIIVTRNGIDPSRFLPGDNAEIFKIGHRMTYSSSPDRGLGRLLELFPRIRAQVPDAELHVYYGFYNWKAMSKAMNNQDELKKIEIYEALLARTEGAINHGRVGQRELANSFLASKVWPYPTWFSETSCITAMEAQAAGCVPITSKIAALNETVEYGIMIGDPDGSEAYATRFVKAVVDCLLDQTDTRKTLSEMGRNYALSNLSWAGVADEWEKMFWRTLANKNEKRMPMITGYTGE